MKAWKIKLALSLNYFVFAILLNSVGTVILQVQRNYGVSAASAGILEACKDLSIAATSFLVASFLARFGYKRAMLIALGFITATCLLVPVFPGFTVTKMLFVATGISFALIKVSVFATIGLVTTGPREHAGFMSFLESIFMVGIFSGYFLFGAFTDDGQVASMAWLHVYYLLAGLAGLAFLLLLATPLDESTVEADRSTSLRENLLSTLRLAATPLVLVFGLSVFTYVLIEQSIMSWLPTFNSHVLQLPATLSIQMASLLAASCALGRFLASFLLRRLAWFGVLAACLVAAAVLVLAALPLAQHTGTAEITGWGNAPLAAFVFPLIGLFIAPIYPAINSTILSALPLRQHGPMAGLIVIVSALGGTTGSLITGRIFGAYGGQVAFYFSLVPIAALLICLAGFNRLQNRALADSGKNPA